MSRSWAPSTTRQLRRPALALLCAAAGLGGCLSLGGNDGPQRDVRALDSFCGEAGACTATGAVERTTGPTADSIGYKLGPGAATLDIPLDDTTTGLEVLARGSGELYVTLAGCSSCPTISHELRGTYTWTNLADVAAAQDAGWLPDAGMSPDPVVEISVRNDGTHADIADLERTYQSCSVAAAGPR